MFCRVRARVLTFAASGLVVCGLVRVSAAAPGAALPGAALFPICAAEALPGLSAQFARALRETRETARSFADAAPPPGTLAAGPADLVLLIHGIDEVGPIWDNLAPQLAVRGYAVARFDYPNDQGLADSAALLHDELRSLRARGVVRITLIAHSMGGLIARDVLTSPDAYACRAAGHAGLPDITRLITVGTPNHGSPLARLRAVLEAVSYTHLTLPTNREV